MTATTISRLNVKRRRETRRGGFATLKSIQYRINTLGCYVCTSHPPSGNAKYPRVEINGRTYGIARLVYEATHGLVPKGLEVRHTCDNPCCIRLDHLLTGTHTDNMRDMVERGRSRGSLGELHPMAILTERQVRLLRTMTPAEARAFALREGLNYSGVDQARRGQTWKHLPPLEVPKNRGPEETP